MYHYGTPPSHVVRDRVKPQAATSETTTTLMDIVTTSNFHATLLQGTCVLSDR